LAFWLVVWEVLRQLPTDGEKMNNDQRPIEPVERRSSYGWLISAMAIALTAILANALDLSAAWTMVVFVTCSTLPRIAIALAHRTMPDKSW
jgi:hypothetical protein